MMRLTPGLRRGAVTAPPSKSHAHRLLIANFLADSRTDLGEAPEDSADIRATKRCLRALAQPTATPTLDCGESGSTLRFLAPVAAALGKKPQWIRRGHLAERPFKPYPTLEGGLHTLPGNISSQFVTGLLFALPLLKDDSQIRFSSPLESRGYVDMTRAVLQTAGITLRDRPDGFDIPGGQTFRTQSTPVEGDWSGAAFWLAMNALGSRIDVVGLDARSAQPDRAITEMLERIRQTPSIAPLTIDVSQCPDIFPVLTVVAGQQPYETRFIGIQRLRIKECDRVAAMADVLGRFNRDVRMTDDTFSVSGRARPFAGGRFASFADHRIAMSVAVGATVADDAVALDDATCAAKSYPAFFDLFTRLGTT